MSKPGKEPSGLPARVRALAEATLTSSGDTSPELRQAIEARAASLGGSEREPGQLPQALSEYVDKVAQHAFKVTDEDFEALKAAGYSEDAIFEITVSAAMGASMARLERGLAALAASSKSSEPNED